jgi:Uma2 family endonuclease
MVVTTAKWTINEYHHMIAARFLDDRCVELLKGEIVEMSPEGEPHAYSCSEVGDYL